MSSSGRDVNEATLIGRLGHHPEKRYTQSGKPVVNLSVATDTTVQDKPFWHHVVVWGKPANTVADYVSKGQLLFVQGEIQYNHWRDNQEKDHFRTEIHADKIKFLDSGKGEANGESEQTAEIAQ